MKDHRKIEHILLTLMKGDEGVELTEEGANRSHLGDAWNSYLESLNLFSIKVPLSSG